MGLTLQSDSVSASGPALLVHGGAWAIPDDVLDAHRDGLRQAVDVGRRHVEAGAHALDVVTETVAALEAHGAFDAGCGAMLNQDGQVELDAGVMDGSTLAYGSVMAVQRVAHPVRVARRLVDAGRGQVRMLVGEGAERFAEAEGIDLVANDDLVCRRERERFERLRSDADHFHTSYSFLPGQVRDAGRDDQAGEEEAGRPGHDTVGAVARDVEGRLAAATSTGGTPFKPPGRVGDSPLPGAGFYATTDAAASATGWGEAIAATVLASRTVDATTSDDPETAARARLSHMHDRISNPEGDGATGGLIVLDASGRGAWAFTTPRMARAGWTNGAPWVQV